MSNMSAERQKQSDQEEYTISRAAVKWTEVHYNLQRIRFSGLPGVLNEKKTRGCYGLIEKVWTHQFRNFQMYS